MIKMIFTYAAFFTIFLNTRIAPVEAVAVPKTDLIKLRFLSTVLAPIYLDYAKYIALTARSHRWCIVHLWKQTNTKETWMPGRERMKEVVWGDLFWY